MKPAQSIRQAFARWTTPRAPIRQPWVALGDDGGAEARAGALLRQAMMSQPLSDVQLAAVRARLGRGRGTVRRTRTLQVAVALAVMLAAGVLLAAAKHFLGEPAPAPPRSAVPDAAHHALRRRGLTRVQPEPETEAAPAEQPAPVDAGSVGPATATSLRPATPVRAAPGSVGAASYTAAPRTPPPVAGPARRQPTGRTPPTAAVVTARVEPTPGGEPSPLAGESRLLVLALRQLRRDQDPAAALRTLDEHAARFGQTGALTAEAETARVEALLRLGRHAEALIRLDGLELAPVGPSRALLAARAELRAENGRCAAASGDFNRLLERPGKRDAIVERALHQRAGCRSRAGDVAGARADLATYLALFPDGRFAAEARAALRR